MYHYDTDGVVSVEDQTNPDNYQPLFGDVEASRLRGQTSSSIKKSFLRPSQSGLYLGLQDVGTCGQINRIIMYYTVCLAKQNGLVLFPEFANPPKGGPNEIFQAKCVCHAHPVSNMNVIANSETGTCTEEATEGAKCDCDDGYRISEDQESCLRTFGNLYPDACLMLAGSIKHFS